MDKNEFEDLLESCEQAVSIAKGELKAGRKTKVKVPNVKSMREKLQLTQEKFSALLGISVWTLRKWEQGVRRPEGAAISLLKIVEKEPQAVKRALLS
jgi:putative transcriptional regulator